MERTGLRPQDFEFDGQALVMPRTLFRRFVGVVKATAGRLHVAGNRIHLVKEIQVKHL